MQPEKAAVLRLGNHGLDCSDGLFTILTLCSISQPAFPNRHIYPSLLSSHSPSKLFIAYKIKSFLLILAFRSWEVLHTPISTPQQNSPPKLSSAPPSAPPSLYCCYPAPPKHTACKDSPHSSLIRSCSSSESHTGSTPLATESVYTTPFCTYQGSHVSHCHTAILSKLVKGLHTYFCPIKLHFYSVSCENYIVVLKVLVRVKWA